MSVYYRINPTDEEGKSRTGEKMTELVQEAHQAHTKKALNGLKVSPPRNPCSQPSAHFHTTGPLVMVGPKTPNE